jgi:hypothetical protein
MEGRNVMKKTILVFGMVLLSLQLPFCPYRFLSNEWVNRLELGRKFLIPIVLQAYGVSSAHQQKQIGAAQPKGFVSVEVSYSPPDHGCTETKRIAAR